MQPSSRTPEGCPDYCPLCGHLVRMEPSTPWGDAPCPCCGHLLWFSRAEDLQDDRSAQSIRAQAREFRSPSEQNAYLDRACGDDYRLRAHIEALLMAHGDWEDPRDPVLRTPGPEDSQTFVEKPGAVIGRCRLLQVIGQGGLGVVYMAEQLAPLERRVALKIMKPHIHVEQAASRLAAERQTLTMLDHPDIARLLDLGLIDGNRLYFVTELIKGIPITKYCDEHRLTPRQRLELFATVCRAVQYAHEQGIIHCNIKPTNVMVTLRDGCPIPKVLDLGMIRVLSQRLVGGKLYTKHGQVVGTPGYMSPEQTELEQQDVDARSDVYSLGALLYQLVTGTTPFDLGRLRSTACQEMFRVIREEQPPRPSTRVGSPGNGSLVARTFRTKPGKLRRLLRRDLDWVVMQSLAKKREQRYPNAGALAADIERCLKGQATEARPSRAYRLRKLIS